MEITSWLLLYLYPTTNLWNKREIGTKISELGLIFTLWKTIPNLNFYTFVGQIGYPLPPHQAVRGLAPASRAAAPPSRAAVRGWWWRAAGRPSWLRLGGWKRRERESWVVRDLREERLGYFEKKRFSLQRRRGSVYREENFFSDLNVRGCFFCKNTPKIQLITKLNPSSFLPLGQG